MFSSICNNFEDVIKFIKDNNIDSKNIYTSSIGMTVFLSYVYIENGEYISRRISIIGYKQLDSLEMFKKQINADNLNIYKVIPKELLELLNYETIKDIILKCGDNVIESEFKNNKKYLQAKLDIIL